VARTQSYSFFSLLQKAIVSNLWRIVIREKIRAPKPVSRDENSEEIVEMDENQRRIVL